MKKPTIITFSGSSNPLLASSIAKIIGLKLGKLEIKRLLSQEIRPRLLESVSEKTTVVVQSLSKPVEKHFFEFALIVDAVKRENPRSVIGVIPWLAYSLQDKRFRKGEPVSAEKIASLIDSLGLDHIILIDLHSKKVKSFFNTPISHITHAQLFRREIEKTKSRDLVLIAPDIGAIERVIELANLANVDSLQMNKVRNHETGEIRFLDFKDNVRGKDCVLCDDVVITGGTLVEAASILKKSGARSIKVFCTHGIFAKGSIEPIKESAITNFLISDTVAIPQEKRFKKLKEVSCADLIARKILTLLP